MGVSRKTPLGTRPSIHMEGSDITSGCSMVVRVSETGQGGTGALGPALSPLKPDPTLSLSLSIGYQSRRLVQEVYE